MEWRVITSDTLAIKTKVLEIAESLAKQPVESGTDISLINGMSGEIILNMYCWKFFRSENYIVRCHELIVKVFNIIFV